MQNRHDKKLNAMGEHSQNPTGDIMIIDEIKANKKKKYKKDIHKKKSSLTRNQKRNLKNKLRGRK